MKSRSRTKFPETLEPGRLCKGMKALDHERKLHVDGTQKPGIQKTLDRHGDLRNLRGGPRQRRDLDAEFLHGIPVFDLPHVNGGIAAFLSVHAARRCPGR